MGIDDDSDFENHSFLVLWVLREYRTFAPRKELYLKMRIGDYD